MDTTSAFTCLVVLVIAAVICSAIPHPQAQTDTRRILVQGSNSEFAHPQNFRRPSNTDSLNRPDESSRGQGQQPDGQWTGFHNQNSQINRTQGLGPGQPSQPHTSTIGHQGVPKAPGVQHHAAQKNLSVESVQARPSNPPLSGFQVTPVRFPGEPTQNRSI
ncbi:hypothetical protein SK128_024760 [Halocaridina rubra]|uniref:Secreted protein n=1 Tax=Halocaridina rubra TaxID=373956 RepID=A0AAN9A4I9_HALRR